MGIKTVPQPPYCQDLVPCYFWLFPSLRGCRYETSEEKKEAVTKVIDTLIHEDFHEAFQKLLERYKCIAAGGDYFEGDSSFMCVLSIKCPYEKSLETYLMIIVYISCSPKFCSYSLLYNNINFYYVSFPFCRTHTYTHVIYGPSTEPSIKRCTCVNKRKNSGSWWPGAVRVSWRKDAELRNSGRQRALGPQWPTVEQLQPRWERSVAMVRRT